MHRCIARSVSGTPWHSTRRRDPNHSLHWPHARVRSIFWCFPQTPYRAMNVQSGRQYSTAGHPHALNRLPGVTAAGSQRNTNGLTASRASIEPWRLTDLLTRSFPTPDTVKPRSQGLLIHPHLTMNWAGRQCRRSAQCLQCRCSSYSSSVVPASPLCPLSPVSPASPRRRRCRHRCVPERKCPETSGCTE